ncbi:Serine protease [Phytophthora megakarya]|uniref:Serine protease n=1 Tax=Phytophthora megakarya TaxID=4795 RepID=A0A225WA49_9STRA|nr:Serine protease [Phytophthora megakarya]
MKTIAVLVALALAPLISAANYNVKRELIMSGEVVPSGTKTYVTGLRSSPSGNAKCGGSLITPTHVLSASHCVDYDVRWVSIGTHYRNGSQDGEQIRVVSVMNHPNYSENVLYADDFLVLELERPSKFNPVKLATADDADFKAGKWATTMGWGTDREVNGTRSYELKRVDLQLLSDQACAANATIDSSNICAGGVLNHDACFGDSGGPLIVKEADSADDVLIGMVSWSKDDTCGREGYPSVFSRVSHARAWIDSITSGNGTCMS